MVLQSDVGNVTDCKGMREVDDKKVHFVQRLRLFNLSVIETSNIYRLHKLMNLLQELNYCTCTYFSGVHILAELALNKVR